MPPFVYFFSRAQLGQPVKDWKDTHEPGGSIGDFPNRQPNRSSHFPTILLAFQVRFARLAAADTSRTEGSIGVRETALATAENSELGENWMNSSDLKSEYKVLGAEMDQSADAAIQLDNMCQCWMWLHWCNTNQ
jgi:hypothetical protein